MVWLDDVCGTFQIEDRLEISGIDAGDRLTRIADYIKILQRARALALNGCWQQIGQ
jgi:hypothetical protein